MKSGISCKMITMIKSMYQNLKSCIKNPTDMSYSDFFDVKLGVKQGDPSSPLLFILFINDIKDCLNFPNRTENDLRLLSVFILLFADDVELFTTDPESVQRQLNTIYKYSCKWGLTIIVSKTKV